MATTEILDRVRVAGSGFTVFHWQNKPIAFARQVAQTAPQPVSPPAAIQPMDAKRPIQVITPEAAGMGSITLELYELYGAPVWDRLINLVRQNAPTANANDVVDIFRIISASPDPIRMTKYIRPPVLVGSNNIPTYTETYHNCVITAVANDEEIQVGSMEVLKQITVAYTRVTIQRSARRPGN